MVDFPGLPNLDYRIAAVADLTGDSAPDIVWPNYITGQNAVWVMGGLTTAIVDLPALANTNYEINGPR